MHHFTTQDFQSWERRYRAYFFNSAGGFKSANLLGSYNAEGVANLALFFSVIHVGSNPPLLGLLFRPHTVPRHTLENLLQQGHFSVNAVTEAIYRKAHATSASYEAGVCEFTQCGLHSLSGKSVPVPYVQESPLRLGCTFAERHDIKANGTILIVARIEEVQVSEKLLGADGFLELANENTVAINNLDAYYKPEPLERLEYARPYEAVKSKD